MRLAWFSPLPPTRSGVAAYSMELLPLLGATHAVDIFVDGAVPRALTPAGPLPAVLQGAAEDGGAGAGLGTGAPQFHSAHEFVRLHDHAPYDLVIYQLGNAACHEYMWPYLVRYPGLAVLHDAQLHHSRAKALLNRQRRDDYRAEFVFSHPDVDPLAAEFVVAGLPGSPYFLWPMLAVPIRASRAVAVHNPRLAADLRAAFPDVPVHVVRMGVRAHEAHGPTPQRDERTVTFAAFGLVTPEKRVPEILNACAAVVRDLPALRLVLVGDTASFYDVRADIERLGLGATVRLTGYVEDLELDRWLGAADACLCLRWPTSRETSASWLRCLAAGKPTVITDLPDLVDVPSLDPRTWTLKHARTDRDPAAAPTGWRTEAVAVAIDLMDERHSLELAIRRLANDAGMRAALGANARRLWASEHSMSVMAGDYGAAIDAAAATPARASGSDVLPAHLLDDGAGTARRILEPFGVALDLFPARETIGT
jgi:glycosyltransferase involved in cell wall biosynthesis